MSNIRVTYSGLISFVVSLVGVFTGIIFTIIVTRQLTQEELGTWGLVGTMTGYFLIFGPISTYWITREIARGTNSGKTGFVTSGLFGLGLVGVYVIFSLLFQIQVDVEITILLFASISLPLEYIRSSLQSITLATRPELRSYGLIIFESTKIPIGFILIYFLQMGVYGAILTTVIAASSEIILLLIKSRKYISGSFNKKYLKKWIKLFWIPTYPKISNRILNLDVVVFSIITGNVTGIAFWTTANAISKIVSNSGQISISLYGKLLASEKKEYFHENLIKTFYFSIPLVAIAIIFAKPGLFILNPIYTSAVNIVIFMSLVVFLRTLDGVFDSALTGIEKVDLKENATFRDYIRSKLFYIPTLRLIQRSVYLTSVIVIISILTIFSFSELELVIYWSMISLFTQIPFSIYFYILVRRNFEMKIQKIVLIKYLISALVSFGSVYVLMEQFLIYDESIFVFLPNFIPFVIISSIGYFGLTFLIDKKTRQLFRLIISEVRKNN